MIYTTNAWETLKKSSYVLNTFMVLFYGLSFGLIVRRQHFQLNEEAAVIKKAMVRKPKLEQNG